MTPADRSRAAVPSEWDVEPTARVLWLIADEDADAPPEEDPILVWLLETEPYGDNWPVLPEDKTPWYDTRWGTRLCVAMFIVGAVGWVAFVAGLIGGVA